MKWLFKVYARKTLISVGKFLASWLTSVAMTDQLQQYGIQVNPTVAEGAITTALLAALKFVEDRMDLAKQNKEVVQ